MSSPLDWLAYLQQHLVSPVTQPSQWGWRGSMREGSWRAAPSIYRGSSWAPTLSKTAAGAIGFEVRVTSYIWVKADNFFMQSVGRDSEDQNLALAVISVSDLLMTGWFASTVPSTFSRRTQLYKERKGVDHAKTFRKARTVSRVLFIFSILMPLYRGEKGAIGVLEAVSMGKTPQWI